MATSRPGTKSAGGPKSAKGSAKKGKKGKKDKGATVAPGASSSSGSENAGEPKEFYILQINDLNEKLQRLKTQARDADERVTALKAERDQQGVDQRDIVEYLNAQISQKDETIENLEAKTAATEAIMLEDRTNYQAEAEKGSSEAGDRYESLSNRLANTLNELEKLNEFRVQKAEIEAKLVDSVEELEYLKSSHEMVINEMEKKYIQDKDRLKKDMLLKVNEIVTNFRKISDKQMAETTKRTIRENIAINKQLQRMSSQTEDVLHENKKLTKEIKNLKRNYDILMQRETEMAKKNFVATKTISILAARVKETRQDHVEVPHKIQREEYVATLEEERGKCESQLEALAAELAAVKQEQEQAERARRDAMTEEARRSAVLSETATFICVAMDDAKRRAEKAHQKRLIEIQFQDESKTDTASKDANGGDDDTLNSESERLEAIDFMIKEIDAYRAARATPPTTSSPNDPEKATDSTEESVDKTARRVIGMVPEQLVLGPPRDYATQGNARGGDRHASSSRSVGVQTVSNQKTIFYADRLVTKGAVTAGSPPVGSEPTLSSMFPRSPSGTVTRELPLHTSRGGGDSKRGAHPTSDQLVTIRFHSKSNPGRPSAVGSNDTRKYAKVAPIRKQGNRLPQQYTDPSPRPPKLFVRVDKA